MPRSVGTAEFENPREYNLLTREHRHYAGSYFVFGIIQSAPPPDALLVTHRGRDPERWGAYHDCFRICVRGRVTLQQLVAAFYTSWLFRIERALLRVFLAIPSSDADAYALARGTRSTFSAWYVGARTATELLMCDRYEQTRSWFRVAPDGDGGTEVCFGSAVVGRRRANAGFVMSPSFRVFLGFHLLYSQLLLQAAARSLAAPGAGKSLL